MDYECTLNIVDCVVRLTSQDPRASGLAEGRLSHFFSDDDRAADIAIAVQVVQHLPEINDAEDLFITTHFLNGQENWRWQQRNGEYIFRSPLDGKQQLAIVDRSCDRVTMYVLPQESGEWAWTPEDIVYDFLQILLINYLCTRQGVIVHSVGVKDTDGRGLLFPGKSGAGKSTSAKLWHQHSDAMILNDDRVAVRKHDDRFVLYGTPWHGDFSDYLEAALEPAPLDQLMFIHHAEEHNAESVSPVEAFGMLYPSLFPTFWNREGVQHTLAFCQDIVTSVSAYRFGFAKDQSVIDYIRTIR